MTVLFLEDLTIGQKFLSEPVEVTAAMITTFARQFDPQPFHLDAEAAKSSLFHGLAASGWNTAALTMKLLVQSLPLAGGLIGASVDELAWPRPVRPGDLLQVESEIIAVRGSQSRPDRGMGKIRSTTRNQQGEPVQILQINVVLWRRGALFV
jgi:acyl dehydratase